jgi:NAD(P)-dependent dehydrogenase (short-subunit alcohol dehydrogenase family)
LRVLEKFSLEGMTALVTGAGTGIGRGLAVGFAEAGASVAICGRTPSTLDETAAAIEGAGGRALAIPADVTQVEDVQRVVATIIETWGSLNVACNNAGVNNWVDSVNLAESDWDWIYDTNTKGAFFCTQAEARVMIAAGSGSIINLASMSARVTNRPQMQAHYNSSKAALVQLTKSLAAEWAPLGVRVNTLSPGYTRTEMADAPRTREAQPIWTRDTPMGRMAEVDELQGAAVFLASDASSYVTGHDLVVDGGFTVW